MDTTLETELVKQIFELLKILIWPMVVLFLVLRFRKGIAGFFDDWTSIAVDAFGVKFSAQKAAEAGVEVVAAELAKQAENRPGHPEPSVTPSSLTKTLDTIISDRNLRSFKNKSILWVDDKPLSNQHEAEAFRKLGISILQVLDTPDATVALKRKKFDIIITDIKRGENINAGYELIEIVLKQNPRQKIVVYTGFTSTERQDRARQLGAMGVTSSPTELFDIVVQNLS